MAARFFLRADQLTAGGALKTGDAEAIAEILVERGGFALIPSDTCYSLAARPTGPLVSKRINDVLRRKEEPISLAFDSVDRVRRWVNPTVEALRLLEHLTPGPLTVVCRITEQYEKGVAKIVDDVLVAPDRTIGVRIPDSHIETQLVSACDYPLTTVAVRTLDKAKKAITDFEQAREIVESGMAAVSGQLPLALVETKQAFRETHSTVVRVPGRAYGADYDIIRQGAIPPEELDRAISKVSKWERKK